ncbi:MAG: MmgE/PrpD family protein [Chloroflexi bacterium]|nr:MmgE/PrpD family protein [Chloroflexota bacterium]
MKPRESNRDLVWSLAENVTGTSYDRLPPETVRVTKMCVLDTLGVIAAASGTTADLQKVVNFVRESGGKEESTIVGFGGRTPAWLAAFANGAMAHCLDYDDLHQHARGHLSANTVPSGFAVAERLGKMSGKDLILAIAMGNDLMARLCYSISLSSLWHRTTVFGVFAAAATSGKLLGLDTEHMVDALGLGFCQASGTMELRFAVGSNIGGMRDGFANQAGVLSALMAQKGIRGVRTAFEGKAGLFNVYYGGEFNREVILADIGKHFHGADTCFKPWPACGSTHGYIDAALSLVNEHDIQPEAIKKITVYVGEEALALCQPLEVRQKPTTTMDAKFSIPFSVAVALVHRKVGIGHFTLENLKDRRVLSVAAKVVPRFGAEFESGRGTRPSRVEIETIDGRTYSKHVDYPLGFPGRPMKWDDLVAKFEDCVSYAAKPIALANVRKAVGMIDSLEELRDASQIIRLLAE